MNETSVSTSTRVLRRSRTIAALAAGAALIGLSLVSNPATARTGKLNGQTYQFLRIRGNINGQNCLGVEVT